MADCELTNSQAQVLDSACAWAEGDPRVRALVLKGSLARGAGHELSDVDLIAVAEPGMRAELWGERERIARSLGTPLGFFDEAEWATPHMLIVLYDGPQKLDLAFEEGEVALDPWLLEGFRQLTGDPAVGERLRTALAGFTPSPFGPEPSLGALDAHAWDWLFWLHVKLEHGETWVARWQLPLFAEHVILLAHNALRGEAWRGFRDAESRFPPELLARLDAALPRSAEPAELRRSLRAEAGLYVEARAELEARFGERLPDELKTQVLGLIA